MHRQYMCHSFLFLLFCVAFCQQTDWYVPSNYLLANNYPEDEKQPIFPAISPLPLYESHWPRNDPEMGAVTAVAVTPTGDPVLLHRAGISWNADSFDGAGVYNFRSEGAIEDAVLFTLDSTTGSVKKREGGGLFYMPHGLHIDSSGNRWVTDVALHQVFKLPPDGDIPIMRLGVAFEPGFNHAHFCQPTDVAIAADGTIFVADGYCNSRIVALRPDGVYLTSFGRNFGLDFSIPHSLSLKDRVLCVADRENGRLVCWDIGERFLSPRMIDLSSYGRIYSVVTSGGVMYSVHQGVTGATGLVIDAKSGVLLNTWGMNFETPHSITASPDGSALYIGELEPPRISKYLLAPSFHSQSKPAQVSDHREAR